MKQVKTSELYGPALDWAVGIAQGWITYPTDSIERGSVFHCEPEDAPFGRTVEVKSFKPSTKWEQGGPIIEREGIELRPARFGAPGWTAWTLDTATKTQARNIGKSGSSALLAAMRCYVASKLGDTVEIPEGLLS